MRHQVRGLDELTGLTGGTGRCWRSPEPIICRARSAAACTTSSWVTETRYYQLLLQLLLRPEAADAEPELLAQLCALLERRRQTSRR